MMRMLFTIFVLIFSVCLGIALKNNPSYVLIVIHHWRIETSLWFALLLLCFLFFLLHFGIMLFHKIANLPHRLSVWHEQRSRLKSQRLTKQQQMQLEKMTYFNQLDHLIETNQTQAIEAFMHYMPRKYRCDPPLITRYCQYLMDTLQTEKAEKTMRQCLKKHFSPSLIALYGQIYTHSKQLAFAESLYKKHGPSTALLLCLGRLAMANQLWGKAAHYLEESIALQPTPEAYAELGKLHELLNNENKACEFYKQGVLLMN